MNLPWLTLCSGLMDSHYNVKIKRQKKYIYISKLVWLQIIYKVSQQLLKKKKKLKDYHIRLLFLKTYLTNFVVSAKLLNLTPSLPNANHHSRTPFNAGALGLTSAPRGEPSGSGSSGENFPADIFVPGTILTSGGRQQHHCS